MQKFISYYVDTPSGQPVPQVQEHIIPTGKTWVLRGISMTAPAGVAKGKISFDGKFIDAWQSDKFVQIILPLEGDGVKKLVISIEGVSVFAGGTIYYEEIG